MQQKLTWQLTIQMVLMIAGISMATVWAYHQALYNELLFWDTRHYIHYNPHIQNWSWENMNWMFTSFYMANWHPLTWLSHALDYSWFGLEPWGHHLINIIFHSLNTLLFFLLSIGLFRIINSAHPPDELAPLNQPVLWAAGLSALFFGIHPQHVESVVWVAERKDLLFLFFLLLASGCYLFYVIKKRRLGYFLALLGFALALMSKPMAITFPVILILLDIYPLKRTPFTPSSQSLTIQKLLIEKIPFFILSAASALLTLWAQGSGKAIAPFETVTLSARFLNAANSVIAYIEKFIFPVGLSPFYTFPDEETFAHYYPFLIPIVAFFLMTLVCGYFWYRKRYYWLIIWIFFLVTLLPVIGILQVGSQAMADRYAYLPTLPFYLLVGAGVVTLYRTQTRLKQLKNAVVVTVVLFIAVRFSQLTYEYTLVWRDDLTLWRYVVLHTPDNPLGQQNLGKAYMRTGQYERALAHFELVKFIFPAVHYNMAASYFRMGQLQKALETYEFILKYNIKPGRYLDATSDKVYATMGLIYTEQGLPQKARQAYQKALAINPKNQQAQKFSASLAAEPH